jgi:hypothetical protein
MRKARLRPSNQNVQRAMVRTAPVRRRVRRWVPDLTTADVQEMSDAELNDIITNGKNKMPKFGSLKPEEIKGLVAYIRTLKK